MAVYRVPVKMLLHALNADRNQSADVQADVSKDPANSNDVIWSAVLDGEAETVTAILESPVHARKAGALVSSATLANGAVLPARVGRLLGVLVNNQYAEPHPVSALTKLTNADQPRRNPLKLPIADEPLFGVTGDNRLIFTGAATATVLFGTYTRPTHASFDEFKNATMLAPDEYLPAVFFAAMKIIGIEGNHLSAMAAYYDRGQRMFAQIRGEAKPQLREMQLQIEE